MRMVNRYTLFEQTPTLNEPISTAFEIVRIGAKIDKESLL
jgi:hypothetical protein